MESLLELDARYTNWLSIARQPGLRRTLASLLAHSGDSWFLLAGLAFIWVVGDSAWKWRSIAMAISVVVTAVVVLLIKFMVRRKRPAGEWGAIYRRTDPHSFPSGHAARAAMLAVVALGLGPTWFAILLAIWAPLVSLARVAMGVHYLSDVVAGMAFGLLVGGVLIQFLA